MKGYIRYLRLRSGRYWLSRDWCLHVTIGLWCAPEVARSSLHACNIIIDGLGFQCGPVTVAITHTRTRPSTATPLLVQLQRSLKWWSSIGSKIMAKLV
jgi:hypothetical protein